MTIPERLASPIAVINSEDAFLIAVRMLLEDEGHQVITASYRTEDPFPRVVAARPALIILDFVHGEPDGWDLLRKLDGDTQTSSIPLIATSTDQELLDRVMSEPLSAQVRTFLLKPLELEQLIETVSEMLPTA
jgi:two-component system phosphate regulon response regulator PhoB